MPPSRFVEMNRPTWERLSLLLDRIEREGLTALSPGELDELGRLYRRVSSHLAQASADRLEEQTAAYLNQLVTRAYARVYAGSRPRQLGLLPLFAVEVPRTFRRHARYIGVSFGLSLLAALVAYIAVRADPRWGGALIGERMAETLESFAKSRTPAGQYFRDEAAAIGGPQFSSFLMSNNIQVALKAFAYGVLLGLGTLYVLVANGLMVGTFIAVGANNGALLRFAAVVAPHGVAELSAICIAGGAGLMLGHAVVDPGDRLRGDALKLAAREAVKLALGTVPMFVVAGIIEGMISPQSTGLMGGDAPRILFGFTVGSILWLYLFFGDRLWGAGKGEAPET